MPRNPRSKASATGVYKSAKGQARARAATARASSKKRGMVTRSQVRKGPKY